MSRRCTLNKTLLSVLSVVPPQAGIILNSILFLIWPPGKENFLFTLNGNTMADSEQLENSPYAPVAARLTPAPVRRRTRSWKGGRWSAGFKMSWVWTNQLAGIVWICAKRYRVKKFFLNIHFSLNFIGEPESTGHGTRVTIDVEFTIYLPNIKAVTFLRRVLKAFIVWRCME